MAVTGRARLSVVIAAALLLFFSGQEVLGAGHDSCLGEACGAGAWVAIPLALAAAALLLLLGDVADETERSVRADVIRVVLAASFLTFADVPRRRLGALAGHLAGRGPPVLLPHPT